MKSLAAVASTQVIIVYSCTEYTCGVSYGGVEGESDVLVVAAGGEGDLWQSEVVLGAGQRGVQHQDVTLDSKETVTSHQTTCPSKYGHTSNRHVAVSSIFVLR